MIEPVRLTHSKAVLQLGLVTCANFAAYNTLKFGLDIPAVLDSLIFSPGIREKVSALFSFALTTGFAVIGVYGLDRFANKTTTVLTKKEKINNLICYSIGVALLAKYSETTIPIMRDRNHIFANFRLFIIPAVALYFMAYTLNIFKKNEISHRV